MNAEDKNTHVVEVFSGSPWEAELVKGLLESNGINSILRDGDMGAIAPYYEGQEVTILVEQNDYEGAMEIIRTREKD